MRSRYYTWYALRKFLIYFLTFCLRYNSACIFCIGKHMLFFNEFVIWTVCRCWKWWMWPPFCLFQITSRLLLSQLLFYTLKCINILTLCPKLNISYNKNVTDYVCILPVVPAHECMLILSIQSLALCKLFTYILITCLCWKCLRTTLTRYLVCFLSMESIYQNTECWWRCRFR